MDEKARSATLTARGIAKAERYFDLENLADLENATLTHHINQALKAHGIMKKDVDYIVKDGSVLIVEMCIRDRPGRAQWRRKIHTDPPLGRSLQTGLWRYFDRWAACL